jgi:uncharacterized protein YacL
MEAAALAFRTLLYRYFFFGWLFKDVNKGSMFEQSAAHRYNKENAHWLFTYLRRWAVLTVLFYALGLICEVLLTVPAISAFFYVPSVLSIAINAVIGVLITWLKLMP